MVDASAAIIQKEVGQSLSGRESLLKDLRKDEVVITGGTGFVGTWLTEFLAYLNDEYSYGIKVHLVARDFSGFAKKLPHLAHRPDVNLIQTDVRALMDLPKNTSRVVHAAANPDIRHHTSQPLETISVIASGTTQTLQAAMRCSQLKSFLNLSSGLVYGSQPETLQRIPESYVGSVDSNSVSSAYAEAKRFGETLCAGFRSQNRLPVINVRPFAFVGPYQRLDHPWAINSFIHDALNARPIRILGDGRIVRSYLYASDMAFWILRMLVAGEIGDSYNLGSSEGVELKTLAEKIQAIVEPSPEIYYRVNTGAEWKKSSFIPEISRASEALGLQMTVGLDEALTRTIRWHRMQKI